MNNVLMLILPIVFYWVFSFFFFILSFLKNPKIEKYKIHQVSNGNRVSCFKVIRDVLFQQFLQIIIGYIFLSKTLEPSSCIYFDNYIKGSRRVFLFFIQFFLALVILDTWQYFFHRLMHYNSTLYRYIHSKHHELYVPYAFGALYNHPVEGLLMDTIGAGLAFQLSGLGAIGGCIFFCFSTVKTVDDHCGYVFPYDPLQRFFYNNSKYHDLHHQPYGMKFNFSQPFFTFWDHYFNTYKNVETSKCISSLTPEKKHT